MKCPLNRKVDQYDFVIMLCAGDLQCFWHFAHYGESFYLHFMYELEWFECFSSVCVCSGPAGDCVALDRHLSVIVNAPSGLIIGTADDESGQIVFSVEETAGFYQMCFSNFHSRFGIVQVFLNFGVYYEGQEKKKTREEKGRKEEKERRGYETDKHFIVLYCGKTQLHLAETNTSLL
ncbi:transmembrane emp24 domain-containing protein 6-like [Ctenopharyngodon idella]|uniref:transmembrane emp24 domain-containing protein 6-like n=1 Tax=Ctenopharyngodon idella TaxID=7959 RepID=UPI00222FE756|nr:transmembrane emp24 domain-containing protein 6-like [Ctenopharyngodon idella]